MPSSTQTRARPGPRATVAADDNREQTTRKHSAGAQLLLATVPFAFVLIGYAVAGFVNGVYDGRFGQGLPNALGFALHIVEPVQADRWIFGQLPTAWLQDRLYEAGRVRWYDALVAVVYVSHFVVSPVIAVVLWFRNRARFWGWVGCVISLTLLGLATYIAYPMAPPWLASDLGVTEPISRISHLGWAFLDFEPAAWLVQSGQDTSNPVAAMPSLHVGAAALTAAFLGLGATWWCRIALASYPLAMTFAVVYTGEHYVIDALVGSAYAFAVIAAWRLVARRREPGRTGGPASRPIAVRGKGLPS